MLSLVLPVRNWPTERIEACIDSFAALDAPFLTEILVIDFGSDEPIVLRDDIAPLASVVRLEAEVWSCGEAINAGVLLAVNHVIAKADSDMLISASSKGELERLVTEAAAGRLGVGIAQATDLHQSYSVGDALALVLEGRRPNGRLRAKWGQGGLVVFSRSTWQEIGGVDSRFTGWGNEDNDFAERVRRSGRTLHWADPQALQIFHVWHAPSTGMNGILKLRQTNQKIAHTDKSVLRSMLFPHSNFAELAAPEVLKGSTPLVTLGIATTERPNHLRMIREAIDSFRGQIDEDFEILVIDNGSSPEAVEELRRSLDKIAWAGGLLRLESTEIASIPGARNLITQGARGRYICVVDDDDIALPNRLGDHLRNFERNGQLHGSHGGWIDFDESTGVIERNSGKQRTAATLLRGTGKITAHPASFYRRDVLQALPYDEAFSLGSDLDLALRMAVMGFEIGHTGSFVTLRRYHSSNVTITGTARQASNGQTARTRVVNTYGWNKNEGLAQKAKESDNEVYCRNQLSIDTLAELIPGYVGQWQIYVPISAFTGDGATAAATPGPAGASAKAVPDAAGGAGEDQPSSGRFKVNGGLLESVFAVSAGDLCTRRAGLNQPIYFRSAPVRGLKRARKLKGEMETLLHLPCHLTSVRQGELDREVPFNWKDLAVKAGERVLRSEEFNDLSTLMACLNMVNGRSAMGQTLRIVSDYNERGQVYCLVSPPIKGYDEIRQFKFGLEQQTGLLFHQIASNGELSELTLGSKGH
ncbi:glycosyltransferase [Devosia sp. 1635]|uniref:glycosyltransferase family 2 protein n=1 Tax=Devosia sp. 1635 TaxID=2726066 RepID=UPI0015677E73|nr:glycosyltransferase [Devosia sp. 1635]